MSIERLGPLRLKQYEIRLAAMLCALPLFGVFGFMTALAALAAGASCVLMPVFDASAAAQSIASQRVSHAVGADSMFDPMLKIPDADFKRIVYMHGRNYTRYIRVLSNGG